MADVREERGVVRGTRTVVSELLNEDHLVSCGCLSVIMYS
jgi:hypothetical protein